MSFVYRDVAMYIFFHYFVFFFSYFIGISIIIRETHDSDWQHNREEAEHNGCGVGNDNVGRQDHDDNEDGDKESKKSNDFFFIRQKPSGDDDDGWILLHIHEGVILLLFFLLLLLLLQLYCFYCW